MNSALRFLFFGPWDSYHGLRRRRCNYATFSRLHTIEHWKLPLAYDHGVNRRDYVVHVYGSTAVLNYRVTIHE